jgi:hypothetical protein
MTLINDRSFLSPAQINLLPGMSSSRFANIAPATVSVSRICQDSNNPSIVIIDFVCGGAFSFIPEVKILRVDADTSYTTNGVTVPILLNDTRGSSIPISMLNGATAATIVCNFADAIPSFLSAQAIEYTLSINGSISIGFNIPVLPQSATYTSVWTKGVLPVPIGLTYNRGILRVEFQYDGTQDCSCQITCTEPVGVNVDLNFCPEQVQIIDIRNIMDGDPFNTVISIRDSFGNISDLPISSVINVNPQAPIVYSQRLSSNGFSKNGVAINKMSVNGVQLVNVQYQILRYVGTTNNYSIWQDWSSDTDLSFSDCEVRAGEIYGYAVRYKDKFNDTSKISQWTSVTV